ncbi:MAG TPA: Ig-like domain-containing protein [Thermoanaerobaculia bacterium]
MRAIRFTRAALCLLVVFGTACSRKPASIQVSPHKVVLYGIGRSERLTAQLLDRKGQVVGSGRLAWASAKPEIATIDNGGRIVSKGGGKTMVTATSGDLTTQVPVEVVDAAGIEVVPAQATLIGPAGTTFTLTAAVKSSKNEPVSLRPTWSSSDEKVAKVSQDGVVKSVGNGTAGMTAHVGELQAAAEVVVLVREIARLEVHPATALVRVGDSQRFAVVAFASDGSRLENAVAQFHSSNPAVATINGGGIASGVAAGTATIHVDVAGRAAEATLIVN